MMPTIWERQNLTLTRKAKHLGIFAISVIHIFTLFRRELAHFDTVMREEFSNTFDRYIFTESAPRPIQSIIRDVSLCVCLFVPSPCNLVRGMRHQNANIASFDHILYDYIR